MLLVNLVDYVVDNDVSCNYNKQLNRQTLLTPLPLLNNYS